MSTRLYWSLPTDEHPIPGGDALIQAVCKAFHCGYDTPTIITNDYSTDEQNGVEILEVLKAAKVEGASELLEVLKKHGKIILELKG